MSTKSKVPLLVCCMRYRGYYNDSTGGYKINMGADTSDGIRDTEGHWRKAEMAGNETKGGLLVVAERLLMCSSLPREQSERA